VTNVWILIGVGGLVSLSALVLIPRPGSFLVVGVCATLLVLGLADIRRRRRAGG